MTTMITENTYDINDTATATIRVYAIENGIKSSAVIKQDGKVVAKRDDLCNAVDAKAWIYFKTGELDITYNGLTSRY